jgi:hypothetical protein
VKRIRMTFVETPRRVFLNRRLSQFIQNDVQRSVRSLQIRSTCGLRRTCIRAF